MAIDWDAEVLGPTMAVFGEDQSPIYLPQKGPSFTLADVVFDREFQEVVLLGDGSANATRRPIVGVRLALFPSPPLQGDRIYIPSVDLTFVVKEVQPDGHGHAVLALNVSR